MPAPLAPLGRADVSHRRPANVDRFWYGACYYPEHWDAATRRDDAKRMRDAGLNVVRMGEFSWDLFEPEERRFSFAFYDEVIGHLGEHGISTIMGTPTAAPPRWASLKYPGIHRVDAKGVRQEHGSRQHACHQSPDFLRLSERITEAMAGHFAKNPHVVGWQTDNEFHCHFSECHCASCQTAFGEFLRQRYNGDIQALNRAWGTAFWAQTYADFRAIPTPRDQQPTWVNPGHRLDYIRFISDGTTRFQHAQVAALRAANPRWFIFHNGAFANLDYRGLFGQDLDFFGFDVYPLFQWDHAHRAAGQSHSLDRARAWTGNFLIPEQQSGPGGQPGYFHDQPEPGEVRQMAWRSIARGADSLLYFRWRTCRFGAEEYWCGIIDHDNVPRRRYDEIAGVGRELRTVGPALIGSSVRVDCAVAGADLDVVTAERSYSFGLPGDDVYGPLWQAGYAVGVVHPADDLSAVKLYVIPHWAAFDPAWVPALERWVAAGGVLVIGARTATRDRANQVVPATPPGCLRAMVGATVEEYGRQNRPQERQIDLCLGAERIRNEHWYEVLQPDAGTTVLGTWAGRHLDGLAAVTCRQIGAGQVIYVGAHLTSAVVTALIPELTRRAKLQPLLPGAPATVHASVRERGKERVWFIFNDGDEPATLTHPPAGIDLLSGQSVGGPITIPRFGVSIVSVSI